MNHKPERQKVVGGIDIRKDNDLIKVVKTSSDINEVLWRLVQKVVKALQKPVITGIILGLLLYDHYYSRLALAASGGSMGWSSFSDSSSSSSDDEDSQSYRTQSKTPKSEAEAKAEMYFTTFILFLMRLCSFCISYFEEASRNKTSVFKLQVF
ncbi:hypothetical protein Tco_0615454 [Tanacetum coccineum]